MKKIIAILLILSCISTFVACGKKQEQIDDGKALETAETYVEITGNAGSISLNENVARTLLGIYDKESLGLSKELYEYELELSPTRFMEQDACLVEAFSEGEEKPEGTFIILGQQCFVYNEKSQEYLLLTLNGPVKHIPSTESQEHNSTTPAFSYNTKNNKKLQERFSAYTEKELGINKELSEYIMVIPGITTTAENGEVVYIIRLHEKSGEATNITLAFNENGNYKFDIDINGYVKI